MSATRGAWCVIPILCVSILAGCQAFGVGASEDSIFEEGMFGGPSTGRTNTKGNTSVYGMGVPGRASGKQLSQNFGPESGGLSPIGSSDTAAAGQYSMNFENADVKEVVRAVLNDALNINYTISGDVSGPVTISSARPITREALLSTLEDVLSSFGFSLVKSGDGYKVAATGLSGGTVDRGARVRAGFGVSIVPLKFVPASTMMELLSGFVAQTEGLRVNVSGNTILIRGTGPQRAEAVEAILSFDSDFMQNQSVSIFRLVQARPDDVVPELERIFNAKGENGLIQFRSVARIRGVLAISKNSTLLRRAETWVRRLDQQDADTGQNIVVYKAKYRKADELAKVMNNLFGGGPIQEQAQQVQDKDPMLDPQKQDGEENPIDTRVSLAFSEQGASDTGIGSVGAIPNIVDLTSGNASGSQIRISADLSNNSVVVYGDSEKAAQIMATLKKLDATPVQVAINVTIAEVRLTKELKYGVQYFINSKRLDLGVDKGSVSLVDEASNVLKSKIPGLNFVLGAKADPDVIISALDVLGDVEVLSSPSLVVLENQTATLQVGDEVPITTRQAQSIENNLAPVINQIEFKNTGIILNVTPRIGQNDAVTMEIEQEISSVSSGVNTLTPTISKRRLKSEISVNDQQTVLLGGLISATSNNGKKGVPGLNRLPILGGLFGAREKTGNRTELIVLIRPVIIRDAQDASNVAESLRSQMYVLGDRGRSYK